MNSGFYRITYTGSAGSGFGMIVLRDGNIAGADVAGGTYDGTYADNQETNEISINTTLLMPAGVAPVQTGIPLIAPASIPIIATLPQADIDKGKPILVQTPIGPVNVIFTKIRDL